jgi:PBP1b-binding outer membrane lipoprotein LpoB
MVNKKFLTVFTVILFSAFVFTSCSGGDTKSSTSDSSSTMQSAPADTSSHMDTTKMDTASTRPAKSPN